MKSSSSETVGSRKVVLIGYGALAKAVIEGLPGISDVTLTHVIVRRQGIAEAESLLPSGVRAIESIQDIGYKPDLVVELAGHSAVASHVAEALECGISTAIASTGALADQTVFERLMTNATRGRCQLQLLPGAVGGIDALTAHAEGDLHSVVYIGRKPPGAWKGTAAESQMDLGSIRSATIIYHGNARESALRFPKNANVAATVALAGLGFDRTEVTLIADPGVSGNMHRIEASSSAGSLVVELASKPLPSNARSSGLAALSGLRALRNLCQVLVM